MSKDIRNGSFVWDSEKEKQNIQKHNVDFFTACEVFYDKKRIIAVDEKHSNEEQRYFCIGKTNNRVLTVRFVYRNKLIRIFGGGYWRKGRLLYEKQNG